MAKRRVTVLECDECGSVEAASYKISTPEEAMNVDLCATHAKPLIALAKLGAPGRRTRKVHTLEDVEKAKNKK